MVVYEDGASEPVRLFDRGVIYNDPETFGEYQLSYRTGDILSPNLETYEPLGMEISDFVNAIRTASPLSSHATLARDVVRLTEAADRSLREGGREVRLQRPKLFRRPTRARIPAVQALDERNAASEAV
jgi:hypothetical protein